MNLNELKSQLAHFGIRPNKTLGQNFLLSDEVIEKIIAAADLKQTDTVLEIGPGLGVLTQELADRAGLVLAIEKDRSIHGVLRKMFKNKKNVKVINDDALFFNPETYNLQPTTYKLIANIPYYITGKLLQNFLSLGAKPSLMVLLLQKEVAERIAAKPGEMSILAVSVQFYADPEIISIVSREDFYPKPDVDSAVVKIKILDKPRFDVDEQKFFQLVKIGFAGKRKQLQNNLQNFYSPPHEGELEGVAEQKDTATSPSPSSRGGELKPDHKKILESLNINPLARAQDLSLDDWARLYKVLIDNQKPAGV